MISNRVHGLGSIHNIREDTHSQLLDPLQIFIVFIDTNRTLHHLCGCLSEPSVSGGRTGLPGSPTARINIILVSHTDTNWCMTNTPVPVCKLKAHLINIEVYATEL